MYSFPQYFRDLVSLCCAKRRQNIWWTFQFLASKGYFSLPATIFSYILLLQNLLTHHSSIAPYPSLVRRRTCVDRFACEAVALSSYWLRMRSVVYLYLLTWLGWSQGHRDWGGTFLQNLYLGRNRFISLLIFRFTLAKFTYSLLLFLLKFCFDKLSPWGQ